MDIDELLGKRKRKDDDINEKEEGKNKENEKKKEGEGEKPPPKKKRKKVSKFEFYSESKSFTPLSQSLSVIDRDYIKNDNTELWLFEAPKDFDVSKVLGHTINIKDLKRGKSCKIAENYSVSETNQNSLNSLVNIFPSEKHNRYTLGKPFSKQLRIISEKNLINENDEQEEKVKLAEKLLERKDVPQIKNLKVRFYPTGTDHYYKKVNLNSINLDTKMSDIKEEEEEEENKKQHKKNKNDDDDDDDSDSNDEEREIKEKIKKKKKKKRKSSSKKKKKKKSKKKKQ
eukprot:TRINITY_DN3367_c1_g6_i1.p1 TRINITY_DN3367_c1_g6~~TRINITY_DN3367_c1_g6_i1.p1  ORF type:complete len:285 (+),score=121.25 TRINITY_DN3367_c1_g6_i1:124-978(+)